MDNNFEIYDGVTFSDLCKDICNRSLSKKDQLDCLVSDLRSLIKDAATVQSYMPRIKELLEVGIKNDEQIVKLASVVQRLHSTQLEVVGGDSIGLSEEDKEQLIQARTREIETLKDINKEVKDSVYKLHLTSSI